MTVDVAVWVLTALALLVVVLTRLWLSARTQVSTASSPTMVCPLATSCGTRATPDWTVGYLTRVGNEVSLLVGALALVLWWILTILGLLILLRWRAARGRHATERRGDDWTQGPWPSVLAHVGMLGGACAFTALFVGDMLA